MISIAITVDTKQLEAWSRDAQASLARGLRSAVEKTARNARREAVKVLAADARIPAADLRASVPEVVPLRSGGGVFSALWTPLKGRNSIRDTAGGKSYTRNVPVDVSTFQISGGGSADLVLPRGFVMTKDGNNIIMTRYASGKGKYKGVYAENADSAMRQERNVVRQAWQQTAEADLTRLATQAVENALGGSSASVGNSSDGHD